MPYTNVPEELWQKMDDCKKKVMEQDGKDEPSAIAICHAAIMGGKAGAASVAGKAGFILDDELIGIAAKYQTATIKAVGDWELDVLAVPFGKKDSDGQTFDAQTDYMLDTFSQPAIIYHHGVMPGKGAIEKKPVIIGKATGIEKQADGLHIRVLLDKTLEYARRVWEAAKSGLAVASSDSISHLARLEVAGKLQMYEKDKPGRIAVWPLAGLSLWDKVDGNFLPASRYAIALPAMKAIYRDGGLPFPELEPDTHGDLPEAETVAAKRAKVKQIQKQARIYLSTFDE